MKRCLCLGIIILATLILFPYKTAAQLDFGVAVSPTVFEITGNPGGKIENQFKVTNRADTQSDIEINIEDIKPSDEEGHVITEENGTYSLANWITTQPQTLSLGPGESSWVKFIIDIPSNAEPGGHYGSVLASAKIVAGGSQTGAAVVPRVGILVLLSVPGEMEEKITVKEFTAPKYSEFGPVNFNIRFENTGTVHVKPSGVIVVTNLLGRKVATISYPEKNILPGSVRKIEVPWNKKILWGGRYTATITGHYGTSNSQLAPVVITFWVFPWKFGLLILALVFLLLLARRRFIVALRILIKGR